ncbi:hypothetical protein ACOSQ2_013183 [Xanthoceras sorbifolium]
MSCHWLIVILIMSLMLPDLPSVIVAAAQVASSLSSSLNYDQDEEVSFVKMTRKVDTTSVEEMEQHQMQTTTTTTSLESTETGVTTNLKPWKGQTSGHHRHLLIRNAHGILNILGWGTLLPAGAIIARYFRQFPLKYDEWYPLHVLCQSSGYLLGTIGWGVGLWLGNSSKQYSLKTHRILGIVVFTFSTIQMLAIFLQPRIGNECRKCWEIYHQIMGYALIGLSIANIFQGIIHQSHAEKWKWVYVGVLAILAFVALALEAFRWIIKYKIQHQNSIAFDNNNNMYNFS